MDVTASRTRPSSSSYAQLRADQTAMLHRVGGAAYPGPVPGPVPGSDPDPDKRGQDQTMNAKRRRIDRLAMLERGAEAVEETVETRAIRRAHRAASDAAAKRGRDIATALYREFRDEEDPTLTRPTDPPHREPVWGGRLRDTNPLLD